MRALRRLPPRTSILVFIDAPYTGRGGTRPGQHLYNQNQVDHAEIFRLLAESGADFLMTYDEAPEIINLITKHAFHAETVTLPETPAPQNGADNHASGQLEATYLTATIP